VNNELLRRFCTPPSLPLTEYDAKVLAEATKSEVPFEGGELAMYRWGTGKTVLLVHGWGSRASHLALMARALAKDGFAVAAPDMPAHSSTGCPAHSTSNMFEYCRALSAVAKAIGPLRAIIGHSFGAMCAAFVTAGLHAFAGQRVTVGKLVLISTPPTLLSILDSFCRHDGPGDSGLAELKDTLEKGFDFRVDDYMTERALRAVSARTLLVHDSTDEEFPVRDIISMHEAAPDTELFLTQGSGHQKILASRAMIAHVKEFLQKEA